MKKKLLKTIPYFAWDPVHHRHILRTIFLIKNLFECQTEEHLINVLIQHLHLILVLGNAQGMIRRAHS